MFKQLKAAVTDLQLRENDRMQNGFSIGDSSSPAVSASMAAEISQLKSALDSARKERQVLEEDRKRERKMFMENNARVSFSMLTGSNKYHLEEVRYEVTLG